MAKAREPDLRDCPVSACLEVIGGRWKPLLLYLISSGCNRFGALGRAVPAISRQMLTRELRELEADGILGRKVFAEIPPRVEYSLTFRGLTLLPLLHQMRDWGLVQQKRRAAETGGSAPELRSPRRGR